MYVRSQIPVQMPGITDTDRRTQTNQLTSPLLCLPPELRNDIYKLVFSQTVLEILPHTNNLRFYDTHQMRTGLPSLRSYSGPTTGLLHTCRQIRTETHHLFFATVTFDIRGLDPLDLIYRLGIEKVALIASVIADRNTAYDPRDGGSETWLHHTQGTLASLEMALLIGFSATADVEDSGLGWTLDWVTGGRLSADNVRITTSVT